MKKFFAIFFLLLGFLSIGPLIYFGFDGKYGMNAVLNNMSRLDFHTDLVLMIAAVIVIFFRLSFYFFKKNKESKKITDTETNS